MRKKKAKKKIVPAGTIASKVGGTKVGTKRKDMRFLSPEGEEWDSKFEWQGFEGARRAGIKLIRCDKDGASDTLSYFHSVRGTSCADCGSSRVGKLRRLTFDFHLPGG